ncbi:MAG TPA: metal-dependent hydrolase [Bacillus sp. (in: firmicutes)]|nr:metal-dependent hydrolase [Bacillus sp. (in: firmicutes)]
MMAKTHQLFGCMFGLISVFTCGIFQLNPQNIIQSIIYFICILFGSILPDLDHPKSKLGSKCILLSYPIYWVFGHRKATHSLLFVGIVAIISLIFSLLFGWSLYYPFGLTLGVFSHIIGDALTNSGVPLLYPNKRKFKFSITFQTGGVFEVFVALLITITNILIVLAIIRLDLI